jgi:hypothetical protein
MQAESSHLKFLDSKQMFRGKAATDRRACRLSVRTTAPINRVIHEVLLATAAMKPPQGIPRAEY